MTRPKRIRYKASDPFDDTELTVSTLCYEPRKAATGFYTQYVFRHAKAAKVGCSQILEGRDPLVGVELLYS